MQHNADTSGHVKDPDSEKSQASITMPVRDDDRRQMVSTRKKQHHEDAKDRKDFGCCILRQDKVFKTTKSRHRLLRGVFLLGILTALLFLLMGAIFLYIPELYKPPMADNRYWISGIPAVISFILTVLLFHGPDHIKRNYPWNLVLYVVYGLLLGFGFAILAQEFEPRHRFVYMDLAFVFLVTELLFFAITYQEKCDLMTKIGSAVMLFIVITVTAIGCLIVLLPYFENSYFALFGFFILALWERLIVVFSVFALKYTDSCEQRMAIDLSVHEDDFVKVRV